MQADEIQPLMDKLKRLPSDRLAEVEDFVDFLSQRTQHRAMIKEGMSLSEPVLEKVWNNDEDAMYDDL